MKLRSIIALALGLSLSIGTALAQTNPGTSPLTPAKGGTNSAFVGFTGPATSVKTFTLPNASDTIATLGAIQTFTAAKTFASAKLLLAGSSSGAGTLNAPAAASTYVWTLPAATDTLVGKATTDTLTNKTFDTAGTGNSLSINGLAATANTGTGAVARATSPTFVTPTLGVATATSINGNTFTTGTYTLTGTAGKTLTFANSLSLAGTDGTTLTFQGTDTYVGRTTTDTLTNKTLTSPTLTTPSLGVATATSINKVAITAPASSATLTIPDGVTLTGPAASGTAMTLGNTETVTGVKTFGSSGAVGRLKVAGTTSGSTVVDASATASGTLTLPAATDTLVGKATTDTLTNKTFDTAGTGNSFSINSLAATANTGTGAVARATSPVFVTPTLGAATATSINGNFFTAGTYTLAAAAGKTFTFNNTLTVAGTDGATLTFQGTDTYVGRTTTDTLTNKTLTSPAISAPAVTGVADVQGTAKLSSFVTSTQITANQNNYTATDGSNTCSGKTTLRISTDASRNITGLSCGQAEGDVRIIHNVGAFSAVLTNQDSSSTTTNRFLFSGDMTLAADTSMTIRYDGVTQRWRQLTTPGAGGGGGGVTSVTLGAGYGISVSGTNPITSSGTFTPAVSLTTANNALTSNVALNTSTYTAGPSMAQGSSGTWLATGCVTWTDTVTANAIANVQLTDGTTVYASGASQSPVAGLAAIACLTAVVPTPAGNIRIQAKSATANTVLIANATSSGNKDSTIWGVRIAP